MKDNIKSALGKTIKQLRTERGITQQELADYANVDRGYISDLERGLYYPSLEIIYKLGEVLKIKPSEMLKRVDSLIFAKETKK